VGGALGASFRSAAHALTRPLAVLVALLRALAEVERELSRPQEPTSGARRSYSVNSVLAEALPLRRAGPN
jgi:hypothetical protein